MGHDTTRAWIAGWDASITHKSCPYKLADYRRAWERGRAAGMRSGDTDVAALKHQLAKLQK